MDTNGANQHKWLMVLLLTTIPSSDAPYFSVELLASNSSALAGNFREYTVMTFEEGSELI
jgi:hypothetical protein